MKAIFFYLRKYWQGTAPKVVVAQTEQYRTHNLISISGSRVITISVTGLSASYVSAIDEAIARYNALMMRLTFRRVAGNADINIQNAYLGHNVLGMSGFPDGNGNPYNLIYLNVRILGFTPDQGYLATIIAHEIGHAIGLRHTDYFNRSYSCGYVDSDNNEGQGSEGAIHIPGTPTAEEPNSFMLACSNGTNRPFNENDQKALKALYPRVGFGHYDLLSTADRMFPFDYTGSGKADHLVLYRPGTGIFSILKNTNGTFSQVFASNYQGVGGFDLRSTLDKVFPFDYTGSGKADHLVLYRPGSGILNILKNTNGTFTQVFASNNQGVGGYDLRSTLDQIFPFDYTGSGKADHLVLYRPGSGILNIVKNTNGSFTQVFASNFQGVGGYDLRVEDDKVFAYDYTGSGKADHLVLYRPGYGTFNIVKNMNGSFTQVFASNNQGVGSYDLRSTLDLVFPFDYTGSGKEDHLVLYRPGSGILNVVKNVNGSFTQVFASNFQGVGGYDLRSAADKVISFDFNGNGKADHLIAYRPGDGFVNIIRNNSGFFEIIY
ncbi:hypothetical protein ECE50_009320 [Chitinophaga sp. Mgbs1]|uniref:Uncharacterized protein n=1 Tax=Chitinophaga solisilvae TaxID=1233460 RepID=A0A433WMV4_9BACT|nr:hypothetical protein [Chitinophaga solisilvae]